MGIYRLVFPNVQCVCVLLYYHLSKDIISINPSKPSKTNLANDLLHSHKEKWKWKLQKSCSSSKKGVIFQPNWLTRGYPWGQVPEFSWKELWADHQRYHFAGCITVSVVERLLNKAGWLCKTKILGILESLWLLEATAFLLKNIRPHVLT
jgi:hypothetical protein